MFIFRPKLSFIIFLTYILLPGTNIFAQTTPTGQEIRFNPISTAVPFLTITPDSRHGAMGNVGVATSPDANSQYLNPSKYAFAEGEFAISASYTPWLRKISNDINLAYLSGYFRLDDEQAIGSSLRYFSMGDVLLTDLNGSGLINVNPNEVALDFSYSRKLSNVFSGGVAIRYIHTNLFQGVGPESYSAGNAFATDVSFFYQKESQSSGHARIFSAGMDVSNIGSKISYDNGQTRQFLPANLRLGMSYSNEMNSGNILSFSFDVNKLLVPTPKYNETAGEDANTVVLPDNSSNQSVISALFSSFSDAPGGLKEELQEYNLSAGMEYWYNKLFALRTGYFHETENKGNRKFFTAGIGVKMNFCSVDVSYLVPTHQNNPLANTIRFTILFEKDSFRKRAKN